MKSSSKFITKFIILNSDCLNISKALMTSFFMLQIIFSSFTLPANGGTDSGSGSDCLAPGKKEATIENFLAVKRSLGCRFSLDPNVCSISLGVGLTAAAALAGTVAASHIRSPNFHICPIKTSSTNPVFPMFRGPTNNFWQELITPQSAWAAPAVPNVPCTNPDYLIKNKALDTIKTAKSDIANNLKKLEERKKLLSDQLKALDDKKYEGFYAARREAIAQELTDMELNHYNGPKLKSAYEKLDDNFRKLQAAKKIPNNEVEISRLTNERTKLNKEISGISKQIRDDMKRSEKYSLKMKEWEKASEDLRNFQAGKPTSVAAAAQAEKERIQTQFKEIDDGIAKWKMQNSKIEALEKKLNNPLSSRNLTTAELNKALDEIYSNGYTSAAHREQLLQLQNSERVRELYTQSLNSRPRGLQRATERLRDLSGRLNPLRSMTTRMGLVGVAMSLASAAASAANAERGEGTAAAMSDLTIGGLGVSSLGCSDLNSYYTSENNNGRECQPNFSLDNGKSDTFFQLSTEQMLAEVNKNPRLCQLIQAANTEAFPVHKKVNCGNPTLIDLGDGNNISIPADNTTNPPSIIHWKDGATTYKMTNDSDGNLTSLNLVNGPYGSVPNVNSSEAQNTRFKFQRKYMADVTETVACCGSAGPRPSNDDCYKRGVRTTLPSSDGPYAPGFRPGKSMDSDSVN